MARRDLAPNDNPDNPPATVQALYVLKNAAEPMDSHAIYAAGSFDYETACYNALNSLWKKGLITREKNERGLYEYQFPKNARLPDYLERDVAEVQACGGLPPPNPDRRIGKSRAEYEGQAEVKRTRSVTVSETVETTEKITKNIPEFIPRTPAPVAVIPASEEIQEVSEPLAVTERLPEPDVAPAPALPAPAKDDAYGAMVWSLVGERDKIDARIAELQLLRFLFDRKASDRLAELLEDYAELLESGLGLDGDDAKMLEARVNDSREWAKRFALQQANERSLFTRAAKHLRAWQTVCEDCGANDTSDIGEESRADAAECAEISSIFEFAAIKLPDPT